MSKAPRILILGGDADHNLGDRAILQSMCHEIRTIRPDARLTVVSAYPERSERAYGAQVIPPAPQGLFQLFAAAARSDLVLCGGGGLFQDDDSLIKMPYWATRVALARALSGRVIGYSLGVGPLDAGSSRLAARAAFACMERVSVRDPKAQRLTQDLTRKQVELIPDPALLLQPVSPDTARGWLRDQGVDTDGRPLIGVAARRWFPRRRRILPHRLTARFRPRDTADSPESHQLATVLAQVLDRTVAEHDAQVLFLPTYTVPHEGDDRICQAVLSKMSSGAGRLLRIDDPALYKGVTGELSVLLGGRMHPTIFAAAMGTPIVGLAYNQKFHGFFTILGLEHQVLDLAAFLKLGQTDELVEMLAAALRHRSGRSERILELQRQIQDFNRRIL